MRDFKKMTRAEECRIHEERRLRKRLRVRPKNTIWKDELQTIYVDTKTQNLRKFIERSFAFGMNVSSYEIKRGKICSYRKLWVPSSQIISPIIKPPTYTSFLCEYNEAGRLVSYSDHKGNEWRIEWQVPFLFADELERVRVRYAFQSYAFRNLVKHYNKKYN